MLVPLVARGGAPHLLFTRRPDHFRQHAGQISFPGGSKDLADASALHTALRETEEELGVGPGSIDILGRLDEVATNSDYGVIPFLGVLAPGAVITPSKDEVAAVIEVPLAALFRSGGFRMKRMEFRGQFHDVYFFEHGEHVIWGATGQILYNLQEIAGELPAWKEWVLT